MDGSHQPPAFGHQYDSNGFQTSGPQPTQPIRYVNFSDLEENAANLANLVLPVRPGSSASNLTTLSRSSGFASQISYTFSIGGGVAVPPLSVGGARGPPSTALTSTSGSGDAHGPAPITAANLTLNNLNGAAQAVQTFPDGYEHVPRRDLRQGNRSYVYGNADDNRSSLLGFTLSDIAKESSLEPANGPNNGRTHDHARGHTSGSSTDTSGTHTGPTAPRGERAIVPPTVPHAKDNNVPLAGLRGEHADAPPVGPRGSYLNQPNNAPSRTSYGGYHIGSNSHAQHVSGGRHMRGRNPPVPPGSAYLNGYAQSFQHANHYVGHGSHHTNGFAGNARNEMAVQPYQQQYGTHGMNLQVQHHGLQCSGPQPFALQQSPQGPYQGSHLQNGYNSNIFHQGQAVATPTRSENHMKTPAPRSSGKHMADRIRSGVYSDGKRCEAVYKEPQTPPTIIRGHGNRARNNSVQLTDTPSRPGRGNGIGFDYHSREVSVEATPKNKQLVVSDSTPSNRPPPNRVLFDQSPPLPGWYEDGQKPTLEQALASLPFGIPFPTEATSHGVVKFVDIPYDTASNEILAVVGGKAKLVSRPVGSPYYAVHLVMDRMNGKTMDAYVEALDAAEAHKIVADMRNRYSRRTLKIGSREVQVEVSTQEELMDALFPNARKSVEWKGNTPRLVDRKTGDYLDSADGKFSGFVGKEETTSMTKVCANLGRSSFLMRTPQRLHDSMISTLYKMPWHAPKLITLGQRKRLYDTAVACLRALERSLRAGVLERHLGLNLVLLQELVLAILCCVGFSEQQKSAVVAELTDLGRHDLTVGHGMKVRLGGSGPFSIAWPFLSLSPKASINSRLLKYYAELVSKATNDAKPTSLLDMAEGNSVEEPNPFGKLTINYGSGDMETLNLRHVAKCEIDAVAHVLKLALMTVGHVGRFELKA